VDRATLDHLFNICGKKVRDLEDFMAEGGCKDYPHYRELCGIIRGLRTAQSEIADLVQRNRDFNDD
jgi:hypothetical protein